MVRTAWASTPSWTLVMVVSIFMIAIPIFGICQEMYVTEDEMSRTVESPIQSTVSGDDTDKESWGYETRSGSYVIVDTGQEDCFDNDGEISSPMEGEDFYGQDAQYDGPQPSYVDNGDGTVSDLNTGLMWQQDPNGFGKVSWDDAMADAASVTTGGHDDWRVPTIKELYSLIDFSGKDPSGWEENGGTDTSELTPFLDTNYFDFEYGDVQGERVIDSQYWSSNEYVSTTMGGDHTVFGVNFADGRIKGYGTSLHGSDKLAFVQYVRGGNNYGINDFVDNGDGTITDLATGLMWMKADSGSGKKWSDALDYAESLDYADHDDWRLPNAKELQGILDYSRSPDTTGSAAIDPLFSSTSITDEGGSTNWPYYWTGTTHITWNDLGKNAAYISFGEALGWMEEPPPGSQNYNLVDVHGAGSQRSDPKEGDPGDYPYGHGPQGDVIRIFNYVRCVRDITSNNSAPVLTSDIVSVSFPEDGSGMKLVNVSGHFTDDIEQRFRIDIEQRGGNSIDCELDPDGYHLNFNSPADWFGREEFRIKAYDTGADGVYDNADDEFAYSNWFNVSVTPTNDPPEIVSVNGTAPSANMMEMLAYPNQTFNKAVIALDPDGDPIMYSSNSTIFVIHESSGLLTGAITNQELGVHWINITATEVNTSVSPDDLLYDFIILKITVRSANERPNITGFTPTGKNTIDFIPRQTILECKEDETTVWSISYLDPDHDACIFSTDFSNQRLELDGSAGKITFSPIQEDVGDHRLNITISDQWLSNRADIVIRVENVNDPPEAKPIIHAGGVHNLTVTLSTGEAYDEDGDELNYTWDFGDGKGGSGLSIDHTYSQAGNYSVILTVSDGITSTSVSKSISVSFEPTPDDDEDTEDDDDVDDDDASGTGDDDDPTDFLDDDRGDEEETRGAERGIWVWITVIIISVIILGFICYISLARKRKDRGDISGQASSPDSEENGNVKWE